ncbi:MAG: alanine--tRNA ligase [Candidatus Binatales bacterium]
MHWTTDRIRQSFLDFFKERGHLIVPSASLIPKGDPTLLFTNAGMVQFKDYFLGVRTPPSPRVADCQKCLRISGKHNDLDAVGRDTYHHTFFEMLGNWSFGDYYKAEAIPWHWKLVTEIWKIDPKLLYATVYKDDDEAEQIWNKLGVLHHPVLRFDQDNFWQMGDTGPCGPCSEINIDRGEKACDGRPHPGHRCFVNVDGCERFIELGNLVFIQYDRDTSGKLTPLPMKCVDTGTGLERVASVLQGIEQGRVIGNYDTDVFKLIILTIQEAARVVGNKARYGENAEYDQSFRAIADHARAITFLLAEGLIPGNADRSYVLRRLIRRAARHGRRLGISEPFLDVVCTRVIESMGFFYSDLPKISYRITTEVNLEEKRFSETLDRGLELIAAERARLRDAGGKTLSGEVAFKLYDTYGFPLDLTQDVLRDDGIDVDVAEFERLMEEQRERGRSARKDDAVAPELKLGPGAASRFVGHRGYDAQSEILASGGDSSDRVTVVAAETPFYPEGGGQVGDRGVIETEGGAILEVLDTRKSDGAIAHVGKILKGEPGDFAKGARVTLKVDRARRDAAMLNHSATHILHYALRDILGASVHQAGSMVAPERLRFDFNYKGPVPERELATIEEEINARIREDAEVATEEMAYDDAIKAGALAFFGDKYGDVVRVVRMGDFSVELCGGTHVDRTGRVGLFKLDAESGVAAGVRRIEAFTGQGALEAIRRREKILEQLSNQLGARDGAALERLERILAREKEMEKKLRALEQKLVSGDHSAGGEQVRELAGGVKVIVRKVAGIEPGAMRAMADQLREKHRSAVVAIGSDLGDKVALLVAVTPDLTSRFKAGDIIKQIAPIVGGSGGGKPELAQAGGKDPAKLDQALERVFEIVG